MQPKNYFLYLNHPDPKKTPRPAGFTKAIVSVTSALLLMLLIVGMALPANAQSGGCPAPGFGLATNFGVADAPYSVTAGDFNEDGKLDLATANQNANNVSILLSNGQGGFSAPTSFGVGRTPRSVTAGDFNADGNLDLATANFFSDNVSVLLGNGTGGFSVPTSFGAGNFPSSVTADDFNADGNLDLATANQSSDNVSVLLGNGLGGFSALTSFGVGNVPLFVTTGDFNRDGTLDLAAANAFSDNVSVLLNTCNPDTDGDGIADAQDNCPSAANANQLDTDNDSQGDACDADDDNDGVLDVNDNCPLVANTNQLDTDGDGQGNACDADDDNDGVLDVADNCPLTANANQLNTDGDSQGNVCDLDDDNDGVLDTQDCDPLDKKKDKVLVCHKDSKGKYTTLCISKGDVASHLNHGDYLGSCSRTSAAYEVAAAETGIAAESPLTIQVLGNPAPDYFTLVPQGGSKATLSIRVLDATGKVLEQRGNVNSQAVLELGNAYRSGIYLVEVVQGRQRVTLKLVKSPQ